MSEELRFWFTVTTLFHVAAFVVWTRLAHAVRGKFGRASAVLFMPMIVAAGVESVSCGWLAFSPLGLDVKAVTFNTLISPLMPLGALIVGAWGLVRLQCPEVGCTRSWMSGLTRELVKSVPD